MESVETWVNGWVNEWGDKVIQFAYVYVRDRGQAQDIAQESFLKLYQWRLAHPHGTVSVGWLFKVTRNLAIDAGRRHGKELSIEKWARELGDNAEDLAVRVTVQDVLERLPLRDRQVLWLFYYGDRSIAEISRDLSISPNGVRLRLFRARQRFSQQWKRGEDNV